MGKIKLLLAILVIFSFSMSVEDVEVEKTDYGLIKLRVEPGYKDVRINKETTLMADNILLPIGRHEISILAPRGYNDTVIVVFINDHAIIKKDVQLTPKILIPKDNSMVITAGIASIVTLTIVAIMFLIK